MSNPIPRVQNQSSCPSRGVQGTNLLWAYIQTRHIKKFEHYFGHRFSVLLRVEWRLS